jgi:hypothetical protein
VRAGQRERHQHSKGAITSPARQLTKCALAINAARLVCQSHVCTFSVALGTCPCRQPQDLFLSLSLWRAAAGQIHNSLNRSCYAIVAWRSVSIPVFVHYILCYACNFADAHNTRASMCLELDLNIHLSAPESDDPAVLAADLSARDLQQQFLCVHAARTRGFTDTCSKLDPCRYKTSTNVKKVLSNFINRIGKNLICDNITWYC